MWKYRWGMKKVYVEVMGLFKKKTERGKGENENRYQIFPVPGCVLKAHYIKWAKGNLLIRHDKCYYQKTQGHKNYESEEILGFGHSAKHFCNSAFSSTRKSWFIPFWILHMINITFYFLGTWTGLANRQQPMLKTKTTRSDNLYFQHKLFKN